jgi:hypothetical protein
MMRDDKLQATADQLSMMLIRANKRLDKEDDPFGMVVLCTIIIINIMEHIHHNTDMCGIALLRSVALSLLRNADKIEAQGKSEDNWTNLEPMGHA